MFISDCWAYTAINGKVCLDDQVLYVTLKNEATDTGVQITFNPAQAKEFAEFLAGAAGLSIPGDKLFPNASITMTLDDKQQAVNIQNHSEIFSSKPVSDNDDLSNIA